MTDYTELVKALRFCFSQSGHGCGWCPYKDHKKPCDAGLLAAAAIEALQAEVPKRGEWIRIDKHTVQCPLCHRYLDLRGVNAGRGDANYCPFCGAKMEVQDADI